MAGGHRGRLPPGKSHPPGLRFARCCGWKPPPGFPRLYLRWQLGQSRGTGGEDVGRGRPSVHGGRLRREAGLGRLLQRQNVYRRLGDVPERHGRVEEQRGRGTLHAVTHHVQVLGEKTPGAAQEGPVGEGGGSPWGRGGQRTTPRLHGCGGSTGGTPSSWGHNARSRHRRLQEASALVWPQRVFDTGARCQRHPR